MDNLRFVLFVFFIFLSYSLWEQWQLDYGPKPPQVVAQQQAEQNNKPGAPQTPPADVVTASGRTASAMSAPTDNGVAPAAASAKVVVTTDVLRIVIDTSGADIHSIQLTTYPINKDQTDNPVELLNDDPTKRFISQTGLLSDSSSPPNHHSIWNSAGNTYALKDGEDSVQVPFTWTSPNGLKVTKVYTFKRGSYLIDMKQTVLNKSNQEWSGRQYIQLQRKEPEKKVGSALSTSSEDRAYTGGVLYTQSEKYEKISFDDMADSNLARTGKDAWIAMIQHYFLAAWIPQTGEEDSFYTKALPDKFFVIGAISPETAVAPGSEKTFESSLFVGPKLQRTLETIAPGLELTVDFGNLTFIAKPIFWLLDKYHVLFTNWGWAIVFVTITIKLLFFQLSASSYRSMANMRKLQPKLKELKDRLGEDKQQFNVAMMELYRKEKVNPLGGCLPVLVQIPVFISLYWVLVEAVELRQAPFIFWLQDLSSKDPYFILPVIYGISMFIQQRLNPQPQDPMQAKVMQYFPLIFTVFFAFFPSGLVLYWVINNTLSILQQWVITRQIEGKAAPSRA
ncbi:membrane protein insertase YidC [Candidatus Methylospira mobilis]|uniref:Membrane protein insertase YidC n=1 Tax=Candidatus Methylospira mobilis TaxID=1808979 RepID=A0A5Q0BNG3_9GAMM|nr:membrane protein insertase YidC [Candidatus Methylospira mobilis]QFY44702.1 membrane protein insertase YidC [Candidatus Methylospira mobilis]